MCHITANTVNVNHVLAVVLQISEIISEYESHKACKYSQFSKNAHKRPTEHQLREQLYLKLLKLRISPGQE